MEELKEMFNRLNGVDRATLMGLIAGFLSGETYGFETFIALYSLLTIEHQKLLGRVIDEPLRNGEVA